MHQLWKKLELKDDYIHYVSYFKQIHCGLYKLNFVEREKFLHIFLEYISIHELFKIISNYPAIINIA